MKTFSIKEAFRDAWGIWKKHKKTITIATIIMLVVGAVDDDKNFSLFSIVMAVAGFLVNMGWFKMLLRTIHGHTPKVSDLVDHLKLAWRYFAATFVVMLIVLGGLVLLVVPGIYFGLKYLFAPVIVLDRGISIREALRESAKMTEGIKWKLLGFGIVCLLAMLAGVLVLVVGIVVSVPVSALASLVVYKKLSQASAA